MNKSLILIVDLKLSENFIFENSIPKRNYPFVFRTAIFLAFGNTLFFTKREITFGEGYIKG